MKRSIISVVTAATVAFALAGCGAGLNSQTADMVAAVPGVGGTAPGPNGQGTVSVRNAMLAYPGTEGYQAGSAASMKVWLFNDTPVEQTVVIKAGGQDSAPIKIAPGGYAAPDVKVKLDKAVNNAEAANIKVEFVGVKVFDLPVPVAPPTVPAPAATVHFEQPAGGEGH